MPIRTWIREPDHESRLYTVRAAMHDRKLKVSSISGVQMLPFRNTRVQSIQK